MIKNLEEVMKNKDPENLFLTHKNQIASLENGRISIHQKILEFQRRIFFLENIGKMIERNETFNCNIVEHVEEYISVLNIEIDYRKEEIKYLTRKLELREKEIEIRTKLVKKLFNENEES